MRSVSQYNPLQTTLAVVSALFLAQYAAATSRTSKLLFFSHKSPSVPTTKLVRESKTLLIPHIIFTPRIDTIFPFRTGAIWGI